jgi:ribosome-binding protein aMBF1 (putative translation factor)
MDGQDWTPIVVRSTGAAKAARHVPTAKPAGSATFRRLDEEELPVATKFLSSESRTEMIKARATKGMTQVQLNTACSFPLHTIRDIENGKLCPTPKQLSVLSRTLGIVMKYG